MDPDQSALSSEVEALRERVAELEEVLDAIRTGQVDALVDGDDIFTLVSAESASNLFRGQVLQQISESVIATDKDQRIIYMNEAGELQYDRKASEVIGLPLTEVYKYEWLKPGDEQAALDAIQNLGHWRGENLQVKRSGEVIYVESVVNVLRDAAWEPIGLLAVIRDISEEVKARNALTESALHKDRFLATLAHELRNPLSPLMNGLQLLEGDKVDPAVLNITRAMMQRQLDILVRLVDDLLDMSRISRGKLELRNAHVDLVKAMHMAVETSRPFIDRNGHQLRVNVQPGTYTVYGDNTRLAQIIANLLNNAAKYTPRGGTITVDLEAQEGEAVLRVSDTGIGIRPEDLGRVFDMFAQVDSSTHGAGGLGIGLNIAKRLAEKHDGRLDVFSNGINRGSSFELHVPLTASITTFSSGNAPVEHASSAGIRILVVDDNEDIAGSMVAILRKAGHTVESAHDGEVAISLGAVFKPQLVLMDIGMPVMDGYEACKRMRAEHWGQRARIVAISGWGQEEDRKKSRDAGFDGHVVKPMDSATLKRQVAEASSRWAHDASVEPFPT
jgi:PAS domain S-box-containing protein